MKFFAFVILCIGLIQSACGVLTTMNYKESITLNCPDTGNTAWFLINNTASTTTAITASEKYIIHSNNSLTVKDLRSSELNYCKFFCNGTGGLNETFSPNPAPYLSQANKKSITVTEGGYIEISCTLMVGFAQNQTVNWTWISLPENNANAQNVLTNGFVNGSYSVNITVAASSNSSTIVLRGVSADMKGHINCTASNSVGSHSVQTIIRVKSTLAALWPFLAIIGEVVILCIIILVFEKKCAKKESTNEDEAENLMAKQKDTNNNNNSDLKKRAIKA